MLVLLLFRLLVVVVPYSTPQAIPSPNPALTPTTSGSRAGIGRYHLKLPVTAPPFKLVPVASPALAASSSTAIITTTTAASASGAPTYNIYKGSDNPVLRSAEVWDKLAVASIFNSRHQFGDMVLTHADLTVRFLLMLT